MSEAITKAAEALADTLDTEFVSARISNNTGRKAAQMLRQLCAALSQAGQDHIPDARQMVGQGGQGEVVEYTPGDWFKAKDRDQLQAFFSSRLPAIREAAQACGYAIGVHGSMRRDMDLIAAPWRDGASDKDALAHAIANAACGITRSGPYEWESKPLGRMAASIPCCWPEWYGEAGAGHIDLSVTPSAAQPAPVPAPVASVEPHTRGCGYCDHPLYAATKCPVCGKQSDLQITQQPAPAVPAVPAGWQLVPVEPTPEMLASVELSMASGVSGVWKALLSAAPKPAGKEGV